MSIFEYIVLALAISLVMMVSLRPCAMQSPIKLSKGIIVALVIALIQTCMLTIGMIVGDILSFDGKDPAYDEQLNELIYIGLVAIVCIKLLSMVWNKKKEIPAYNISRWSTVFALSIARGIDVFLLGMANGFIVNIENEFLKATIPLFVALALICYWAIMLGRQKTAIQERRWTIFAIVMLLAVAIFRIVDL